MRRAALVAFVLLALCVPGAQAALTKTLPFSASYGYLSGLDASGGLTITSGAIDATSSASRGSVGILNTEGFTVGGLTRVCWNHLPSPCMDGQLSLTVQPGGSVGLCFPSAFQSHFTADHTLALFVNLQTDDNLNTLPVNRSLVAPSVDGVVTLSDIQAIPNSALSASTLSQPPCTGSVSGGIAALNPSTSIALSNNGAQVASLTGKDALFLFAGAPTLLPVRSNFVVLPFNPGAATFKPASAQAATTGLNLTRMQDLLGQLDQAHNGSTTQRQNVTSGLQSSPALTSLLNGALLRMPVQANGSKLDISQVSFVRFTSLRVVGSSGSLTWSGQSLLAVQDGHVAHEHSLVKLGPVGLPWWSFLLWAAAIATWIVALVLKAPKHHPRWDSLRWIGWVAGPLAFVLVLWLVDLEVLRISGSSFLKGSSGNTKFIFLAIDFGLAATLYLMLQLPLRILLRASFRLLRQGTLMGLAGPIATILGFFLGYSYFRAYLDLVFSQVVSKLG